MKTPFCLFLSTILSTTTALAERKIIQIGTKPESVCRGFGGKLYVTMPDLDELWYQLNRQPVHALADN